MPIWPRAAVISRKEWLSRLYGGIHPGDGTRNSLLSLADNTYIEILGRDPAQADSCLDLELQRFAGAGLYHWAAGGVDLAEVRAKAIAAGLDGGDLVTGDESYPMATGLAGNSSESGNHGFGALVPSSSTGWTAGIRR